MELKFDLKLVLILVAIALVGVLLVIHHQPASVKESTIPNATKTTIGTNTTSSVKENVTNVTKAMNMASSNSSVVNVSVPKLNNSIAFSFNLTNSTLGNELKILKNSEIYFQISGYFNQFPTSPPEPVRGELSIVYMEITVYNGSIGKSVILPVLSSVNYTTQRYFIYQVEGNLPQLQQLANILKQNEFIEVTFYTNSSLVILGYTIW
jgi:hypothetical protein